MEDRHIKDKTSSSHFRLRISVIFNLGELVHAPRVVVVVVVVVIDGGRGVVATEAAEGCEASGDGLAVSAVHAVGEDGEHPHHQQHHQPWHHHHGTAVTASPTTVNLSVSHPRRTKISVQRDVVC